MEFQDNRIQPFRVIGNVYFVGGKAVSVHILKTEEGLIMMDTGYPFMKEEILSNMRAVGLDPNDVRIILQTHGHYDHNGNTKYYQEHFPAVTCLSRIDYEALQEPIDFSWADQLGEERLPLFRCDRLLEDGDIVSLGSSSVRCVLSPGHTKGTMTFFFDTEENGRVYRCAMHGGVGTNSMETAYLQSKGLSADCRDHFRESLHKLALEHVDVVLGSHPQQNDTEGKLRRLLSGETDAFIDSEEWQRFLKTCERNLDEMIAKEAKMANEP